MITYLNWIQKTIEIVGAVITISNPDNEIEVQ